MHILNLSVKEWQSHDIKNKVENTKEPIDPSTNNPIQKPNADEVHEEMRRSKSMISKSSQTIAETVPIIFITRSLGSYGT